MMGVKERQPVTDDKGVLSMGESTLGRFEAFSKDVKHVHICCDAREAR